MNSHQLRRDGTRGSLGALKRDRKPVRLIACLLHPYAVRESAAEGESDRSARAKDLFLLFGQADEAQLPDGPRPVAPRPAAPSWPLPPSMTARSGSGFSSARRRLK